MFFENDKFDTDFIDVENLMYDPKVEGGLKSLKKSLISALGAEVQEELSSLREEVKKLREHESEYYEYKHDIDSVKRHLANSYLEDIVNAQGTTVWGVHHTGTLPEKCDKCDERRKIHYKTPLGRDATEDCTCAERNYTYESYPMKFYKMYHHDREYTMYFRFVKDSSNHRYDHLEEYFDWDNDVTSNRVFDTIEEYEDNKSYAKAFKTKEVADKYCKLKNVKV